MPYKENEDGLIVETKEQIVDINVVIKDREKELEEVRQELKTYNKKVVLFTDREEEIVKELADIKKKFKKFLKKEEDPIPAKEANDEQTPA